MSKYIVREILSAAYVWVKMVAKLDANELKDAQNSATDDFRVMTERGIKMKERVSNE